MNDDERLVVLVRQFSKYGSRMHHRMCEYFAYGVCTCRDWEYADAKIDRLCGARQTKQKTKKEK